MKSTYKALADFQQEVPVILKDTQGYGYNYADWPTILGTINPLMAKHGLGFTQLINTVEGVPVVQTTVFHVESGEEITSVTPIPQGVQLKGMNEFQVLGSAITYIKRYALSSMLGLVTDKDTDAHGEQVKKPANKNVDKFMENIQPTDEEVISWIDNLESATTLKQLKDIAAKVPPMVKDAIGKTKFDEIKSKIK